MVENVEHIAEFPILIVVINGDKVHSVFEGCQIKVVVTFATICYEDYYFFEL